MDMSSGDTSSSTKKVRSGRTKRPPVAGSLPAGKTAPKRSAEHPGYIKMVSDAIAVLKDRKGSSRASILKYIQEHYKLGSNSSQINAHLRQALKRGLASGKLHLVKGSGLNGSFKLGSASAVPKKIARKPREKKSDNDSPKKPQAKKSRTGKSPKQPKKMTKLKTAGSKAKRPKKVAS